MGGESGARGRSEAVRGGGSEGGEGRMDNENPVVRRLEDCVEEQAEQIEALLEEVGAVVDARGACGGKPSRRCIHPYYS